MSNYQFGNEASGQPSEKRCGPACAVEPDRHGRTKPHFHRSVATHITPEGLPIHGTYPDPPAPPPRVHQGFERRSGLRRSGEQPRTGEGQTLMDHPELRPFTYGQVQYTNHGTASRWRIWKSLGRANRTETGRLNDRSSIEMEEFVGPRTQTQAQTEAHASQPVSPVAGGSMSQFRASPVAARSFIVNQQSPIAHRSADRRALSFSAHTLSPLGSPILASRIINEVRQPVAHSPTPRSGNPEALVTAADKALRGFRIAQAGAERGPPSGSQSAQKNDFEPERVFSPRALGKSRQREFNSLSRPGTSPSSPIARDPSLRRIASQNAANRDQSSISAARPSETDRSRDDPEDDFSLRHIQLRSKHCVKARFAQIEENCREFEHIELYETVQPEVYENMERIKAFMAKIDAENLKQGGRPEEEEIWDDFLVQLESVERDIEAEHQRLRDVREARHAQQERERKAAEVQTDSKIDLPLTQSEGGVVEPKQPEVDIQRQKVPEIDLLPVQSDENAGDEKDPTASAQPVEDPEPAEPVSTRVPKNSTIKTSRTAQSQIPRPLQRPSTTRPTRLSTQSTFQSPKQTLSSQNKQRAKPTQQPRKAALEPTKPRSQLKAKSNQSSQTAEGSTSRKSFLPTQSPIL